MMNSIESCSVNISGLMKDSLCANRQPANPVMAALIANDLTLYSDTLTPMLRAAVSLSRIATKARPVGERKRLSVPTMVRIVSGRKRMRSARLM